MNTIVATRPSPLPGGDDRDFNLIRWFSITALISVAAVSMLAAWGLSAFLTERMIRQEAEVTARFLRSIIDTEHAYDYFEGKGGDPRQVESFLSHMNTMPDVLRTNVYSLDKVMLWSSDASLIGRRFDQNEELDEALQAQLVINSGVAQRPDVPKSEHVKLDPGQKAFVENYIPVFDAQRQRVVGVIELYKIPSELFDAIAVGKKLVWLGSGAAGLFIYSAMFWIIRRAQRTIIRQREQLIESESLAVVGEMGSAVAHGLRNPLASIRSSAELALEHSLPPEARECADDIVAQVDRLEGWVRQLLTYAKPSHALIEPVDINAVLRETLAGYGRDLERKQIEIGQELDAPLPAVGGEPALLSQLIGSLIVNAVEAMPRGGRLVIRSAPDPAIRGVCVEISDSGVGLPPEQAGRVFKPFFTTKQKGLGLGLPLVRRVIERLGGGVEFDSTPEQGTTVRLRLRGYVGEGS